MNLQLPAVLFLIALAPPWITGCLEPPPEADSPQGTAQTACKKFIDCVLADEPLSRQRNFMADCMELHSDVYSEIDSQLGEQCLETHLETERCYAHQSCEDWEDDVGCEEELEREKEVCGVAL